MAISESQLETWSKQGAIIQSKDTYAAIRLALQDNTSAYADKEYDIFLQGSYCNDSNIYADSDVDVVIKLNSTYYHDTSALPADELALFNAATSAATYSQSDFKNQVLAQLRKKFPSDVTPGNKAIYIKANGARRDADVVPTSQFRRFYRFRNWADCRYDEGITFWTTDNIQIINYPKQHSTNCTRKHQATAQWFKPTVRILKNMRNSMISKGYLEEGVAPSYFLEGMLYNVPDNLFGKTYEDTIVKTINWVIECPDKSKLVCANEQYLLLHPTSPVTWRDEKMTKFLQAVGKFWDA